MSNLYVTVTVSVPVGVTLDVSTTANIVPTQSLTAVLLACAEHTDMCDIVSPLVQFVPVTNVTAIVEIGRAHV